MSLRPQRLPLPTGSDSMWLIRSLFPIDSHPVSAVKPTHPKVETPGSPGPMASDLNEVQESGPHSLFWPGVDKGSFSFFCWEQTKQTAQPPVNLKGVPFFPVILWCCSPEDPMLSSPLLCKSAAFSLKEKRRVNRVNDVWQWNGELAFFSLVQLFTGLCDTGKDSLIQGCGWEGAVDGAIGIGYYRQL